MNDIRSHSLDIRRRHRDARILFARDMRARGEGSPVKCNRRDGIFLLPKIKKIDSGVSAV